MFHEIKKKNVYHTQSLRLDFIVGQEISVFFKGMISTTVLEAKFANRGSYGCGNAPTGILSFSQRNSPTRAQLKKTWYIRATSVAQGRIRVGVRLQSGQRQPTEDSQ